MISIYTLSIKTYSLAKGSNPGKEGLFPDFLYYILAEVKIHYTQHGGIFLQVRYSTSTFSLIFMELSLAMTSRPLHQVCVLRTEYILARLWLDLPYRDSNP